MSESSHCASSTFPKSATITSSPSANSHCDRSVTKSSLTFSPQKTKVGPKWMRNHLKRPPSRTDKTIRRLCIGLVLCLLLCVTSSQTIICNFDFTAVTASDTQAVDSLGACPSYDLGGGDTSKYPGTDARGLVFSDDKLISTSSYFNYPTWDSNFRSFGGWLYYSGGEIGVFLSFTQQTATGEFIETTFEKRAGSMLIEVRVNGNLRHTMDLETGWQWVGTAYRKYLGVIFFTYSKTWGKTNGVNTDVDYTDISFVGSGSGEMWMGCHSPCPSGASFIIKDFYFQDYYDLGWDTNSDYHHLPFNPFFWAGTDAYNLVSGAATCWAHAAGSDTSALDSNCYVKYGRKCELDSPSYTYLNETSEIYCQIIPNICGNGVYDSGTEECEDGNSEAGDGCENNCTITPGFTCSTNSSTVLSECLLACEVENCSKCSTSDANICEICKDGLILSADSKSCSAEEKMSDTVIASGAIVGAVGLASLGIAISKVSSPQEIWLSMNFLQMVDIALLFRVGLPDSIKQYISGMGSFAFPITFLSIEKIPFIAELLEQLGEEIQDQKFIDYDFDSTSVVREKISTFVVLFLSAVAAIGVFCLNKCLESCLQRHQNCNKVLKWFQKVFVWNFFWRMAISEEISLMVISIYELKLLILGEIQWGVSSYFAVAVVVGFIFKTSLLFWMLRLFLTAFDPNKHYMNGEFFTGLKSKKWPWLQVIWTTIRRYFFIIAVVIVEPAIEVELTWLFLVFQIIYLAAIVVVRPLAETSHNLIEIVCETVYLIFLSILAFPKGKDEWPGWVEATCKGLLFSNNLIVMFISLVFVCISVCKWYKNRGQARANRVEQRPRLPTASRNEGVSHLQLNREDASGISATAVTPPAPVSSHFQAPKNKVDKKPHLNPREETKETPSSRPTRNQLSMLPAENPHFKEEEDENTPKESFQPETHFYNDPRPNFHPYRNQMRLDQSFPTHNAYNRRRDFSPQPETYGLGNQFEVEAPQANHTRHASLFRSQEFGYLDTDWPKPSYQDDLSDEFDLDPAQNQSNWKDPISLTKAEMEYIETLEAKEKRDQEFAEFKKKGNEIKKNEQRQRLKYLNLIHVKAPSKFKQRKLSNDDYDY